MNKSVNRVLALLLSFCSLLILNTAVLSKDADAGKVQVKGYTKKDGTVVKGYSRDAKSAKAADTTEVKGYTKKNGTVVKGYTRKKTTK